MAIPLASLIFGTQQPLRIESKISRADVLARLDAQIVPWGHDGLRGKASEEGVNLYVVSGPFRRNSWRPVFDGHVEQSPSGSTLVGTIGLDSSVRFVVLAAVVIAVFLTARDLFGFAAGAAPEAYPYALRWLLFLPALAVFNYIGRVMAQEDELKLRTTLKWTLDNHVG